MVWCWGQEDAELLDDHVPHQSLFDMPPLVLASVPVLFLEINVLALYRILLLRYSV